VGSGTAENPQPMGHFLAVRLQQAGANRDAIGAGVEVTTADRVMRREITVGGGHAGGQLGWIHFGLGDADSVTVRVIWPDGERGPALAADADTFGIVTRGATEIEPWVPPQ
jgi:enediyne biosynthesis protein E4